MIFSYKNASVIDQHIQSIVLAENRVGQPVNSVFTGRDAIIRLIDEEVGHGRYFNVTEEEEVHAQAYDEDARDELISRSRQLINAALSSSGPD